jgi:SAM-dependent methyltransferase
MKVVERELREVVELKWGSDLTRLGWGPRRRLDWGYYLPAEFYEAVVNRLVTDQTRWLDVGGGHDLFPDNEPLAHRLAARARLIVGVDPSDNIHRNRWVQERHQASIEDFEDSRQFDLVTLRMVAEHVTRPEKVVQALKSLVNHGGHVVLLTVNAYAPVTIVSRLMPFNLHYPVKRFFWGGQEEDTFPTAYRMNTRGRLRSLFEPCGFHESLFMYVDDLSVFARFRTLNLVEHGARRFLRCLGIAYPENCLLAVYQRSTAVHINTEAR